MASISSIGLGSGIDAESIISQLLTLEKQPITKVESENTKLNTKLSTWGRIQSGFSALKDSASALAKDSFWSATTAKSSDETAVTVTTGTDSVAGSYKVEVQALAKAQYLSSGSFASKTDPIGEGTLRIELGKFTPNPDAPPAATFAAKAAAQAVDIDIGPGDNTLEKIRDKINASNSGVTASLVNDASGTRLVLRGSSTGEENAFKISATESGSPGLSALAFDPSADITTMTRTQEAGNAEATINGIEVSSSTNTLSDVIDGLTIKLGKITSSAVDITVNQDTASIKTGIDSFVKSYNDVVGLIRVQTLYDEASKTGGPLQGDSTATSLLRQLRSMAVSSTSASSVFDRLSDLGLEMSKEGTLSTDSAKLTSAMGNLGELKKLFASTSDDANIQGIAVRFKSLAEQVTDSDGSISSRTDGIKSSIKRNEDKIDRMEQRVTLVESRLRSQYTALDQSMAKLNSLSNYVTQQLSTLSSSS